MIQKLILQLGADNYLQAVNEDDFQYVQQYCTEPGPPTSYEFLMVAQLLMRENNLRMSTTVEKALDFYITLKTLLNREIENA